MKAMARAREDDVGCSPQLADPFANSSRLLAFVSGKHAYASISAAISTDRSRCIVNRIEGTVLFEV